MATILATCSAMFCDVHEIDVKLETLRLGIDFFRHVGAHIPCLRDQSEEVVWCAP